MLAVIGAWLQLALAIGVAATVIQISQAFAALGPTGISDPERMSVAIGHVLVTTFIGMAISLVGLILICLALYRYRYRAPWLWYFLIPAGALLLVNFPLGTPFGIAFLVTSIKRRAEFFPAASS